MSKGMKESTHEAVSSVTEEDEINLFDLLFVLVKHKRMIVGSCAATFLLVCLITLMLPNIYTATARILPPTPDKGRLGGLSGMLGGMGDLAALAGVQVGTTPADLYVGMLKSRTIADAVIDQFDLMTVHEQEFRTLMYAALNELVRISLGKADGIIEIRVDDEDPQRAAAIANAYVDELKKLNLRINVSTVGRERKFLEERLVVVVRELARAENDLKQFQEEHKAILLDEQTKGLIESIARLKGVQASKEVELGVLLSYQTEQNREVRALRESINQIREQVRLLEQSPSGGPVSSDAVFAAAEVPELGLRLARLMRDYKVQETLFELLTTQYEMAKINEAKNTSPLQVLDEAVAPDRKSKPKRALIVLLATFAVGFVALLMAFVTESLGHLDEDNRQRWEQIKSGLRWRRE